MTVSIGEMGCSNNPPETKVVMSIKDFMNQCTACDGNGGSVLLTGIKKVFPNNYGEVEKEYNSMCFLMVVFIHMCSYVSG